MPNTIYLIPTQHAVQRSQERGVEIPHTLDTTRASIRDDNRGHLKLKIKSTVYVVTPWCGNMYELITCFNK